MDPQTSILEQCAIWRLVKESWAKQPLLDVLFNPFFWSNQKVVFKWTMSSSWASTLYPAWGFLGC